MSDVNSKIEKIQTVRNKTGKWAKASLLFSILGWGVPMMALVLFVFLILTNLTGSLENATSRHPFFVTIAVTSFTLSFIALISGVVSLIRIRLKKDDPKGKSISLVGLYLCSMYFAFVFGAPLLVQIRKRNVPLICRMVLSDLHKAMQIYMDDYNEYPTPDKWCDLLVEHADVDKRLFVCPSVRKGRCNYAINPNANAHSIPDTVLLFETEDGWNQFGGPEILTFDNHEIRWGNLLFEKERLKLKKGKICNILFTNGEVKEVKPEQVGELKWKVEENE